MKINEKYGAFTKAELFNISQGAGCKLFKDLDDSTVFTVEAAVFMMDELVNPENGETKEKEILHIKTSDAVYTTESPTVIRTFRAAVQFMEDYRLTFKLLRGKSKNNRSFMDLQLLEVQEA